MLPPERTQLELARCRRGCQLALPNDIIRGSRKSPSPRSSLEGVQISAAAPSPATYPVKAFGSPGTRPLSGIDERYALVSAAKPART